MIVNAPNLTALTVAYSAAFRAGFGQAPKDHEPLAMSVPSMTAEQQYPWLGQFPGLREWVGERVLRGIAEHGYALRNRKFETTVEVLADAIRDDQHGVYTPLFTAAGEAAAAHPCQLVYEALRGGFWTECYDGQYFFDSDHPGPNGNVSNVGGAPVKADIESGAQVPWYLVCGDRSIRPILHQQREPYELQAMNRMDDEHVFTRDAYRYGVRGRGNAGYGLWQLAYGSVDPLNVANYETARVRVMEGVGDEGRVLGYKPTHLIVPPSLEHEALELLKAERLANGQTNVYRGTAELVVTPWLA